MFISNGEAKTLNSVRTILQARGLTLAKNTIPQFRSFCRKLQYPCSLLPDLVLRDMDAGKIRGAAPKKDFIQSFEFASWALCAE
jgi:hypothetical protein